MKKQFDQMAAENMVASKCEKTVNSVNVKSSSSVGWLGFLPLAEKDSET